MKNRIKSNLVGHTTTLVALLFPLLVSAAPFSGADFVIVHEGKNEPIQYTVVEKGPLELKSYQWLSQTLVLQSVSLTPPIIVRRSKILLTFDVRNGQFWPTSFKGELPEGQSVDVRSLEDAMNTMDIKPLGSIRYRSCGVVAGKADTTICLAQSSDN